MMIKGKKYVLEVLDNFYYLKINIEDIIYIYKIYLTFIDDGLEIFTKYNKSYYFVFNNIRNKFENIPKEYKDNISFISKHIKNKVFFNFKTCKERRRKRCRRYYYKGKEIQ